MSARRWRLQALENRIAPATIQWDGGPTGDGTAWLDPVNWKGNVAPGPTDVAQLDSTGTNPTISVSGSASAQVIVSTRLLSVEAGGKLNIGNGNSMLTAVTLNGGAIDLQNGAVVSATSFQGSGALAIAAGRSVTLAFCTSGIPIDVSGTLIVGTEFTVNAPMTINKGGVVRVAGDGTTTSLLIYSGLTNHGLLELTSAASGQKALVGVHGGSFTNAPSGTVASRVGLGGAREIHLASAANQFINQGSVLVESGLNVTRSGTGQLVTNSGTITVNAGQTLNINASVEHQAGTLTGGGSAILNSVKLVGNLTPSLASLSLNGLSGTGKLTIPSLGVVTARSGSAITAPIENAGLLIIHGSCSIGAGFTSKPASTIRIEGEPISGSANLHTTAAFTNHGMIELTSAISSNNATLTIDSGSFANASDGSIKILPSVGGSRFLNVLFAGQFTNQGLVSITGTDLFFSGPPLVNAGTLNIGIGTMLSTATSVNNNIPGVITGSGTIKSASLSGAGTIAPNGALAVNNAVNLGGPLAVDLDGASPGSFDRLQIQSTVTLAGPLDVNLNYSAKVGDEFVILANNGSDSISGSFSNVSNGTLSADGAVFEVNYLGDTGNDVTLKVLSIGPTPPSASIQVNNGSGQRSLVTAFHIYFSEAVTFPDGTLAAFQLQRTGPGNPTNNVALSVTGSGTNYDINFVDPILAPGLTKSLIDGQYRLTLLASKIQGVGGALNGGVDQVQNLYRLFGDADGNGTVNSNDFAGFRGLFGTGTSIFDINGDNATNAEDFGAFRARFGINMVP